MLTAPCELTASYFMPDEFSFTVLLSAIPRKPPSDFLLQILSKGAVLDRFNTTSHLLTHVMTVEVAAKS